MRWPCGNSLADSPKKLHFKIHDLQLIDRKILPIPVCDQAELEVALKIHRESIRLGDTCEITRGEINQTIYKKYISSDPTHRPLLKGVEVKLFGFNEESGRARILNEGKFEKEKQRKRPPHLESPRNGLQG